MTAIACHSVSFNTGLNFINLSSLILQLTNMNHFITLFPKAIVVLLLLSCFLCNELDPELTYVPIKEESFIELFYCVRKDHPKSPALEQFSDYVYQNVDVYE